MASLQFGTALAALACCLGTALECEQKEASSEDEVMLLQRLQKDDWPKKGHDYYHHYPDYHDHDHPQHHHPSPGPLSRPCPYNVPENSALLIIDMQNDFIADWGTLKVDGGASIIPLVNDLTSCEWTIRIFTEDYHPNHHISFASTSPTNVPVYGFTNLTYTDALVNPRLCSKEYAAADLWGASVSATCHGTVTTLEQQLWPDHCVQGTLGQDMDSRVTVRDGDLVTHKGYSSVVDSYGAILNNLEGSESNIGELLATLGVQEVFVVGLAYDYCVKYSALQTANLGFKTTVFMDGTKPVFQNNIAPVKAELEAAGVSVTDSSELLYPHPWK